MVKEDQAYGERGTLKKTEIRERQKPQFIIRGKKICLENTRMTKGFEKTLKEYTERLIPRLKLVKLVDFKEKAKNFFACVGRKNM